MLFNGTDTGAPLKHALLSYNISHGLSIHIFEKIAETTTKIQEKEKSMIGKYRMRTDLAMENQEKFERDHVEISGVEIEKKKRKAERVFHLSPPQYPDPVQAIEIIGK